jgi:hypothetical protein
MTPRPIFPNSRRPAALLAALPLALGAATPAWAAPLDLPVPSRELILLASLLLLTIALAARIMQRHSRDDQATEGPDMRWWKNP